MDGTIQRCLAVLAACVFMVALPGRAPASDAETRKAMTASSYARALQALDTRTTGALKQAADRYSREFATASQEVRDDAFLALRDFHRRLAEARTAEILDREASLLTAMTSESEPTAPLDMMRTQVVPELNATPDFRQNGLRAVYRGDGTWQVIARASYLVPAFRDKVSSSITEFLLLEERETADPPVVDGTMSVPFSELATRYAAWERYVTLFPKSPFADRAEVFHDIVERLFLEGAPGSGLTEPGTNNVRADIVTAWRDFVTSHSDVPSTPILARMADLTSAAGGLLTGELERQLARARAGEGLTTATATPVPAAPPIPEEYRFAEFRITVADTGELTAPTARRYRIEVRRDDTVATSAVFRSPPIRRTWVEDLDRDGGFEIIMWTRPDSENTTSVLNILEWRDGRLEKRRSPGLTKDQVAGYRGHDEFRVEEAGIARTYPVYAPGDETTRPTAGYRRIAYSWEDDTWRVEADNTLPLASDYLELAPGRRWTYDERRGEQSSTVTVEVLEEEDLRYQLCRTASNATETLVLEVRPGGVGMIGSPVAGVCGLDGAPDSGQFDPVLLDPVTTGARFDGPTMTNTVQSIGSEAVIGGRVYPGVAIVVREPRSRAGLQRRTDYYAPGVGLIRSVLETSADATHLSLVERED